MKPFLIFSITCLVAVDSLPTSSETTQFDQEGKTIITECAEELNANVEMYTYPLDIGAHIENPDDETICMAACSLRRWINETLPSNLRGPNNKETVFYGLLTLIGRGYGDEYSHHQIVDKLITCYDDESTECDFFKCVEVHKPPFGFMVGQRFDLQQPADV